MTNQLTELDLSNVPGLTTFWCWENQLTELDLSNVLGLTDLRCNKNQLTELDLSNVPELTELWCNKNQLTELDLSNVPELTELLCMTNQLTELDLSNVPALTDLRQGLPSFDIAEIKSLQRNSDGFWTCKFEASRWRAVANFDDRFKAIVQRYESPSFLKN